ncbi:MAG: DinB family protein [Gemmatimonadota bacterium]
MTEADDEGDRVDGEPGVDLTPAETAERALEVLVRTPGDVAALLGRADPGRVIAPVATGKWSPLEILCHLAQTEWVLGYRTRIALCEDHPTLHPFDPDRWVARGVTAADEAEHLSDFAALRRANIRLWRSLTAEELARTAYHAGLERDVTLGEMLSALADHDVNHLDQMRRGLSS